MTKILILVLVLAIVAWIFALCNVFNGKTEVSNVPDNSSNIWYVFDPYSLLLTEKSREELY